MALEPSLRRHWPQTLISWARLLAGDIRNPVVAGHVLVGLATGLTLLLLREVAKYVAGMVSAPRMAMTVNEMLQFALTALVGPVLAVMALFAMLVLLGAVLRRPWLATTVAILFMSLEAIATDPERLVYPICLLVGVRFGLLPMLVAYIFVDSLVLMTTNLQTWYATAAWVWIATVVTVTLWAFRHALGGRPIWKGDFLDA